MQVVQPQVRLSLYESRYVAIIIAVFSALVYAGTLGFQFVYDDVGFIAENPALRSWRFVSQYFRRDVWAGLDTSSYYYRPLHLMWSRLNYALFGLYPAGWHFTSIALHALATLLVFRLVERVLHERTTAVLAALIFGLHPIHVQSVAWVSGSPDPLLAIFVIAGFLAYLNFRHSGTIVWLIASLLAYGCAVLTKEAGIVMPAIIFVHEYLQPSGTTQQSASSRLRRAGIAVLPYAAVTIAYLAARLHALQAFAPASSRIGILEMILTWPAILWLYSKHLFLLWGYSLFYDIPPVQHLLSREFLLPAGLLILAVLAISAVSHLVKLPAMTLWAGATWLAIPLLPALYLPAVDPQIYGQDRYLYLSTAGFAMLVAAIIRRVLPRDSEVQSHLRYQLYPATMLTVILIICTVIQQQYWRNNVVLFRRAVAIAPHNNQALNNLAVALAESNDFADALPVFDRAIHQNPDSARLNYNYGFMLYRMRQYQDALRFLSRAAEIDSSLGDAFLYMGMSHLKLGYAQDAALEIAHAISLQPHRKGAHLALGAVLETQGDIPGAIKETKAELSNYPGDQIISQRLNALLRSESASQE